MTDAAAGVEGPNWPADHGPPFFAAAAVLFAGALYVFAGAGRAGRELSIERAIKKPHWVQLSAQGSLMLF